MLDQILSLLDATDWTRAFIALTIVCAMLIVYAMNLISYEQEDQVDPVWLQWIRRAGYAVTALSLLWSLNYMQSHQWQPWPPYVLLILGIIIGVVVKITAIRLRISREGSRRIGLVPPPLPGAAKAPISMVKRRH